MYTPRHFHQTDQTEIVRFLQNNAFGQLTSNVGGRLFATHIPFLVSEDGSTLLAHIAKANPQWKELETQEALITFQGPHDYISPSWYTDPGVPTWNYMVVHIYGTCIVMHDADAVRKIVEEITTEYEAQFTNPWKPDFRSEKLSGIVGLKVCITDVQAKFKLSQNRSGEERQEVARQLKEKGSLALAKAMSRNRYSPEQT